MPAFYNEIDKYAAQWTRNLIDAGLVAPGVVDERSIADLKPEDVRDATQAHFFSGIAVWSHALRLAGWPDDLGVWTGSCPCQPFSQAGSRGGTADTRHLWPEWFRLIKQCRPPIIFGEQVGSSVAVGPAREVESVQRLCDREAVLGVLHELEGRSPLDVQRMREVISEDLEAEIAGEGIGGFQAVEGQEPRGGTRQRRKTKGQDSRNRVRTGLDRHPIESQRRILRTDRHPVQAHDSEVVGCTVAGSHRPDEGVHGREHASSTVLGERHGEHVGAEPHPRGRERDQDAASIIFGSAVDRARRETDGTDVGAWIEVVQSDMESIGYTIWIAVLPAAGVSAPHIRQRLWFVAIDPGQRDATRDALRYALACRLADDHASGLRELGREKLRAERNASQRHDADGCGAYGGSIGDTDARPLADDVRDGLQARDVGGGAPGPTRECGEASGAVDTSAGLANLEQRLAAIGVYKTIGSVGDTGVHGDREHARELPRDEKEHEVGPANGDHAPVAAGAVGGFWADADWVYCRDDKYRPVEPRAQPVVDGSATWLECVRSAGPLIVWEEVPSPKPLRTGMLRAYGNAIVAPVAAEFIAAVIDVILGVE